MNLEEIRTEVEIKLFDPASYGPDQLNEYINSCLVYTAGVVSLPTLKRVGAVSTVLEQAYVNISESLTFSGHLKKVLKAEGQDPVVYPDLERLLDDYVLDQDGDVEAVALEGNILWYARTPEEAESLTLLYYTSPSRLIKNSDVPTDLPEHCHRKLMVHGTLWMLFDEIENASELEGQKIKTQEHFWHSFDEKNPVGGINLLRNWLARIRPHHISSVWNI